MTRWNGTLTFLEEIEKLHENNDKRAPAFPDTVVALRNAFKESPRKKLQSAIQLLLPFRRATLQVESDQSDIIDAIEALGTVLAHVTKLDEQQDGAFAGLLEPFELAFRSNFLSPA